MTVWTGNYVFVVGCGHTGTTLMATILDAHPAVAAIREETGAFLPNGGGLEALQARAAAVAGSRTRWVCEKTPRHVGHWDFIQAAVPRARAIVMLRDGQDTVASLKVRKGNFAAALAAWRQETTESLALLADPAVWAVRYEDLVTDFEPTVRGVCRWLGLRYDPAMARFHERPGRWFREAVTADGAAPEAVTHLERRDRQMHQPLFDGRGVWRSGLTVDERAVFWDVGRTLMADTGYLPGRTVVPLSLTRRLLALRYGTGSIDEPLA